MGIFSGITLDSLINGAVAGQNAMNAGRAAALQTARQMAQQRDERERQSLDLGLKLADAARNGVGISFAGGPPLGAPAPGLVGAAPTPAPHDPIITAARGAGTAVVPPDWRAMYEAAHQVNRAGVPSADGAGGAQAAASGASGANTPVFSGTLGGRSYNLSIDPSRSADGMNRDAFAELNRRDSDRFAAYHPGVKYGDILQQADSNDLRHADPLVNRSAYDAIAADAFPGGSKPAYSANVDWTKVQESAINASVVERPKVDFRVQFPPQGGAGSQPTANEQYERLVQAAKGRASVLARDADRSARGDHNVTSRVGYVRNYLRQEYGGKLDEGVLEGIADGAVRSYLTGPRTYREQSYPAAAGATGQLGVPAVNPFGAAPWSPSAASPFQRQTP